VRRPPPSPAGNLLKRSKRRGLWKDRFFVVQGTTCTYFSGENGEEKGKVSSGASDGDSLFTRSASPQ
jgi:hypothetical protein